MLLIAGWRPLTGALWVLTMARVSALQERPVPL
jgi:hypothetical protein